MKNIFLLAFVIGCGWFVWTNYGEELMKNEDVRQTVEYVNEKRTELIQKKEELEIKIKDIKKEIETKTDQSIEKINEIRDALEQAQKAYEQTTKAINEIQKALDIVGGDSSSEEKKEVVE